MVKSFEVIYDSIRREVVDLKDYEQLEKALAEAEAEFYKVGAEWSQQKSKLQAELDAANKHVQELTLNALNDGTYIKVLKQQIECKQIELDLSRNSNAEIKARVAELETSKAWNETTIATQNVTNSINNLTINRLTQSNDAREGHIQRLLRHAFLCSHNSKTKCSCSQNIQEFLKTDKSSLAWAAIQKENK